MLMYNNERAGVGTRKKNGPNHCYKSFIKCNPCSYCPENGNAPKEHYSIRIN